MDYVLLHHNSTNKEGKNYALFTSTQTKSSTPVWDPAANNFWTTKPTKNYRAKSGKVNVATGQSADIIGEGESKLGSVNLENIQHVPTFTHDLVSGIQLMKEGHTQTLDADGYLTVKKNGKIVMSGKYDASFKLIRIDLQN